MTPVPASRRLAMRSGLASPPLFSVGWHDALFEHYRVIDDGAIARRLPDGLELDRHDGAAYVSVVSFRMVDMRWTGRVPLPLASTYPQINVRTYVRAGDKTGVFFLRNHVSNRLAAAAGRRLYGMPYRHRHVENAGPSADPRCEAALGEGLIHRVAGRRGARVTGHEDDPGSLLFFLVERYPLFSDKGGVLHEAQMLHRPWELHALEGAERTHAIVADLGLDGALAPLDEVQTSPGVNVLIWPAVPLGTMEPLVAMDAPECPSAVG
jgi:uncharacterized protein YqjF (DUF2071 family)